MITQAPHNKRLVTVASLPRTRRPAAGTPAQPWRCTAIPVCSVSRLSGLQNQRKRLHAYAEDSMDTETRKNVGELVALLVSLPPSGIIYAYVESPVPKLAGIAAVMIAAKLLLMGVVRHLEAKDAHR